MLFAKGFPIGLKRYQHIIKRFFHRNRAAVRRGISAFNINPFILQIARRGQSGFLQHAAQRHAGIFHIMDHTMRELNTV